MPTLSLKNITIKEKQDKNLNPYYLIDQAYFCFLGAAFRDGWQDLITDYENIKEVEIEYTEKENNFKTYRQVVSLYSPESDIIV